MKKKRINRARIERMHAQFAGSLLRIGKVPVMALATQLTKAWR